MLLAIMASIECFVAFVTFFLLLLITPNMAIYEVKSMGFLNAFKRNEPLVLFRTEVGIQMLIGNQYVGKVG